MLLDVVDKYNRGIFIALALAKIWTTIGCLRLRFVVLFSVDVCAEQHLAILDVGPSVIFVAHPFNERGVEIQVGSNACPQSTDPNPKDPKASKIQSVIMVDHHVPNGLACMAAFCW